MNKAKVTASNEALCLRIADAQKIYPVSRGMLMRLAEKANAVRRIGRTVLIYRPAMDEYIEKSNNADMLEAES